MTGCSMNNSPADAPNGTLTGNYATGGADSSRGPTNYELNSPASSLENNNDDTTFNTAYVALKELMEIPANTSYGEILDKLGKTSGIGNPLYRQYITYDNRLIQLKFDNPDDICPYSGAELFGRAMPLDGPAGISAGHYGILAVDGSIIVDGRYSGNSAYLITNDAEIVFENGTPATEDNLKPETAVLVEFDNVLYGAPEQWHCTKIIILDSVKPAPVEAPYDEALDDGSVITYYPDGVTETKFPSGGVETYLPYPGGGIVEYTLPQNPSPAIDHSELEDLLGYDTVRVTKQQLSDIETNTSYADILEKLGKTQAFGQSKYRQYITDDNRIIQLYFESKDDLCPYSGAELYERALPLEYDGEKPEDMSYGLLAGDGTFFTYYMEYYNTDDGKIDIYTDADGNRHITGDRLMTSDAEIVFEDGTPAAKEDLKPETAVFVQSDYTLESYPGQRHCTKIVILK